MKKFRAGKIAVLAIALFGAALVMDSCASGPQNQTRKKNCRGKKTANTQRIKRMAPSMAR